MAPELHEKNGKVTLDAIRRLYHHQNSRVTLYQLVKNPSC